MKKPALITVLLSGFSFYSYSQNVGIGTAAPVTRLHVSSTVSNAATFNGDNQMWITLAENNVNRGYIGSYAGNAEDVDFGTYSGNNTGRVHLTTGNTPRLSVNPNGNIGIGTTAPEAALHIKNTGWIKTIFENNTGEARGYIGGDNNGTITLASNAYWDGSSWQYPNTGASLYLLLHRVNNRFEFRVRPDGGSQSTAMVIGVDGNVGIGTTNPLTTLDINGSIRIGNSSSNQQGSIRYNNNRFEGYSGTSWKSFDQGSASSVTTSRDANDVSLVSQGYKYIGAIPGVITRDTVTSGLAANTWVPASEALNFPPPLLTGESVVWTGNNLIVWGGANVHHENIDPQLPAVITYGKGYYYDFDSNLWDTLKDQQEGRYLHSTIWTGTEMIIWGGRKANTNGTFTVLGNGARFNGASFIWTTIGGTAPTARYNHTAVWTGTEMIVWGGQSSANNSSVLGNGARYNPATNTWTSLSAVNAPVARTQHTAVWVGGKMVIWGGLNASGLYVNTGAVYDPVTDTWSAMSLTNAPLAGYGYASFVNGNSMVVWGGNIGNGAYGHSYNVTTNTWTTYSPGNNILNRMYPSIINVSGSTIVFGGYENGSELILNEAYRNNAAIHPPADRAAAATELIWTGNFLIAYGGFIPSGSGSVRFGTNRCTRLFLTAQSVTNIQETIRMLFLYQKN